MRKTKYTTLPVKPQTAYILKRYAKIHGWAMTTFLDNLATMLYLGIDGLLEWDISELKKYYCYSDIMVASDVREAGWIPLKPIKEGDKNE